MRNQTNQNKQCGACLMNSDCLDSGGNICAGMRREPMGCTIEHHVYTDWRHAPVVGRPE